MQMSVDFTYASKCPQGERAAIVRRGGALLHQGPAALVWRGASRGTGHQAIGWRAQNSRAPPENQRAACSDQDFIVKTGTMPNKTRPWSFRRRVMKKMCSSVHSRATGDARFTTSVQSTCTSTDGACSETNGCGMNARGEDAAPLAPCADGDEIKS